MIVFRYLSREILTTFFAVTLVLLLIFLSTQFVHHLGAAATGRVSGQVLWYLMLIEIPHLLGLLMPLCFFLAILLVYGRLYVDGEMVAFMSCGLNKSDLMKITLSISALVSLLVGYLSFSLNPKILAYRDYLLANENTETLLASILPGRFQQLPGGQGQFFYVEKISRDKKILENIFLAGQYPQENKLPKQSVLFAKSGMQENDLKSHHAFLVLHDGYRYLGIPGQKEYQIIHFKSLGVRLDKQYSQLIPQEQEAMSTLALWKDTTNPPASLAELQWRISLPLSVFLLGLLAFSMSEVKPRQGRYAKLIPAVLIYTFYANLLFIARNWVSREVVSSVIGMWWVHAMLLLVIAFFLSSPYLQRMYHHVKVDGFRKGKLKI
jgi:lipopolysaccharide export system permease protein